MGVKNVSDHDGVSSVTTYNRFHVLQSLSYGTAYATLDMHVYSDKAGKIETLTSAFKM
jgi:hypothetical protein